MPAITECCDCSASLDDHPAGQEYDSVVGK
jgi:hypothetical protein